MRTYDSGSLWSLGSSHRGARNEDQEGNRGDTPWARNHQRLGKLGNFMNQRLIWQTPIWHNVHYIIWLIWLIWHMTWQYVFFCMSWYFEVSSLKNDCCNVGNWAEPLRPLTQRYAGTCPSRDPMVGSTSTAPHRSAWAGYTTLRTSCINFSHYDYQTLLDQDD